ncbi:MAG TPA: hypothetical protein VH394_13545, partial [Thermoanaerobaculia bacterium]|nr:hypothetical protein [Thermoanaerobaculia bacterium]
MKKRAPKTQVSSAHRRQTNSLFRLYSLLNPRPTGHPLELGTGPRARRLTVLFDRQRLFDPVRGIPIDPNRFHWLSNQNPIRDTRGYADAGREGNRSSFGHFCGPFATVIGGAVIVVTGGTAGLFVGGLTIIGGFSWAADDIGNWHDQLRGSKPSSEDRGAPEPSTSTVEITDEEAEEDLEQADEDDQQQEAS